MPTSVLEPAKTKSQVPVYEPTWSTERVLSPRPAAPRAQPAKKASAKKVKKIAVASGIAAGALLLAGMNTSGAIFEHDWVTLLCIAPQTLALTAVFVTWFSCFLFGDV
jgi:hypothetical protein